ncbi:MAG: aminotransferase class V-fold PLP-dependent enzyme [Chthoniobacterales bacterium]
MSPFFASESERLDQFPILRKQIYLGHAGVTTLPTCAADAMTKYIHACCADNQEFEGVIADMNRTRVTCAKLIGAHADEIALLGPTSLGLSLFANGIDWKPGDELLCYQDDYPSNVYPWLALEKRGVTIRFLKTQAQGQITPELVAESLTAKTRMVALASCHYLTGWRIDIDAIGALLHKRGILFSLDAIQTAGAFPVSVKHVDFLSADAHKWMLGPLAIGIVYVAREHFETCQPTLLGAWNIKSPNFVTQDKMEFYESARRYEPGVLNTIGMYGMKASLEMLLSFGIDRVSEHILSIRNHLLTGLLEMGFQTLSPLPGSEMATGIVTVFHPDRNPEALVEALAKDNIFAAVRHDREGKGYLRFSPHFYNTLDEMDKVLACLRK